MNLVWSTPFYKQVFFCWWIIICFCTNFFSRTLYIDQNCLKIMNLIYILSKNDFWWQSHFSKNINLGVYSRPNQLKGYRAYILKSFLPSCVKTSPKDPTLKTPQLVMSQIFFKIHNFGTFHFKKFLLFFQHSLVI